jgi:hypothetical protein
LTRFAGWIRSKAATCTCREIPLFYGLSTRIVFLFLCLSKSSLLAEVSICAGNPKEKRPLPRSDTSSVHDRGRVKPVCKTSSETGLGKQIVRMLRAELRCNDIEPVVSKCSGHFEVFMLFEVL